MKHDEEWLTRKQLAAALGYSRKFIWTMERTGFRMVNGRATLAMARIWLFMNPAPTRTQRRNAGNTR